MSTLYIISIILIHIDMQAEIRTSSFVLHFLILLSLSELFKKELTWFILQLENKSITICLKFVVSYKSISGNAVSSRNVSTRLLSMRNTSF